MIYSEQKIIARLKGIPLFCVGRKYSSSFYMSHHPRDLIYYVFEGNVVRVFERGVNKFILYTDDATLTGTEEDIHKFMDARERQINV